MINLRTDVPLPEEVIQRVQTISAQIRDLLLEQEQVLLLGINKKQLLKREEVAKLLRCDEHKIPRAIPRIRVGKNWLFELQDVESFIESKKRKVS